MRILLALMALLGCSSCILSRPDLPPARIVDPQLALLASRAAAADAKPLRLLPVTQRQPIERAVILRGEGDELVAAQRWSWAAQPSHYLQDALRAAIEADPRFVLSDALKAEVWAVELRHCEILRSPEGEALRLVASLRIDEALPEGQQHQRLVEVQVAMTAPPPGGLSAAASQAFGALAKKMLAAVAEPR